MPRGRRNRWRNFTGFVQAQESNLMKLKSLLTTFALAASSLCLQARGPAPANVDVFRATEDVTELIGLEVWNLQNVRLGKIKFITADLINARLVEVVVTTSGGFLGFGGKTTSVPPRSLMLDKNAQVARLDMSKAKFNAAPKFNTSDVAAYSDRRRLATMLRYYGLEPWFYLEGQAVQRNARILRLGHVQKTSSLLNLQIKNRGDQYLGSVGSLMMDLSKGQIVHVVATTAAMGGAKNAVIQARDLQFNAAHNGLVLDRTLAEFAGEPQLKWHGGSKESFQQETYVNREVQADKGLHSRQSAQEGLVRNATVMEEGESFRDEQKTRLIKQRIQADPALSAHAKHVEVVTLHAQTTLRGHVNTLEGKRRIGEIAAKAGRPENVSNLIEIRPH
jgi:sporulation protein YlmC with PRC-barrel domain